MENNNEEFVEARLDELEESLQKQTKLTGDLLDYLERTDINFKSDLQRFDNWQNRLETLRQEERVANEIKHAKQVLGNHGYLVIADEAELDMARVKKWVSSKDDPSDDIPF